MDRFQRARLLLGTAFGLALVNSGWTLHSRPGEFYLSHGNEQLSPNKVTLQLSDGVISKDLWSGKCREWGIEGVSLAIAAENDNVLPSGILRGDQILPQQSAGPPGTNPTPLE